MGEEKRYGGLALAEVTQRNAPYWPSAAFDLARDLLAAQQRIAELEAKLDRVQALVPKFRWKAKKLDGSRYGEGGSDAHTDCADDLAEALEQPTEKGPTP